MTPEQKIERVMEALIDAAWQKPSLNAMQSARIAVAEMEKIRAEERAAEVDRAIEAEQDRRNMATRLSNAGVA